MRRMEFKETNDLICICKENYGILIKERDVSLYNLQQGKK